MTTAITVQTKALFAELRISESHANKLFSALDIVIPDNESKITLSLPEFLIGPMMANVPEDMQAIKALMVGAGNLSINIYFNGYKETVRKAVKGLTVTNEIEVENGSLYLMTKAALPEGMLETLTQGMRQVNKGEVPEPEVKGPSTAANESGHTESSKTSKPDATKEKEVKNEKVTPLPVGLPMQVMGKIASGCVGVVVDIAANAKAA